MATIIRTGKTLSAPLAGTPYLPPPFIVSDTFTGPNGNITGRAADAALGGSKLTWVESAAGHMAIAGGLLTRGTAGNVTGFSGFNPGKADVELGVRIAGNTDSVATSTYLDVRRSSSSAAGSPDAYRLKIGAGTFQVQKRVATVTTSLSASFGYAIGDRLAIRVVGTTLTAYKNGAVVYTVEDASLAGPGWHGIATSNTLIQNLDDFYIKEANTRP